MFLTYFDTEKFRAVEKNDYFQRGKGLAVERLNKDNLLTKNSRISGLFYVFSISFSNNF